MAAEGVSFRHAVELLRDGFTPRRVDGGRVGVSQGRKLETFDPGLSNGALLEAVTGFYHDRLMGSPDALGWLEQRKLLHPEALTAFEMGVADRSLGYRVPHRNWVDGAELRGRLQGQGVYRASGHEHFNGAVVVPIRDRDGQIVEVYGRRVGSVKRSGRSGHLFLHDEPRGVFNLAAFEASDELIICEGLVDALTMWAAGLRNVTATWGPDGLHGELRDAIGSFGIGRVVLALDNDPAGNAATEAVAVELGEAGVECFGVRLPQWSDVNDVACASDDPASVLGDLVREATPLQALDKPAPRRARRDSDTAGPPNVRHEPIKAARSTSSTDSTEAVEGEGLVAASPVPPPPVVAPEAIVEGDQLSVSLGRRRWRLRGLGRNSSFDVLRANVLVSAGEVFHVDTLDLYSARARGVFVAQAAAELGLEESVVKRDLGKAMLAAEAHVEAVIAQVLEADQAPVVVLDAAERATAMALLTDPALIDRIRADFAAAGIVGESTNLLVGYLAATSRLLERPLAVIVQSTSAAGKSQLMDAVLGFIPDEDQVRYSAMTGQSLYYLGEGDLAHKVLAVAEEEGAERAAYALKLLQSEGEISIASTGKDTASGRLVTHDYRVSGPTAIFLTTTAIDVDEELLNRCLVLSVDEDASQTRAIHVSQRAAMTLDGLIAKRTRSAVAKLHQDAQRLLEPVVVVNPFAGRLGFADGATRMRRDHMKYLTLISAIALLHQHQRPKQTATLEGEAITYIEATMDDIGLANDLAHEVLGHSLDELPPQTRRLLGVISGAVAQACERDGLECGDVRFCRRDVRGWAGWSDFQVRTHLGRLVDLEYVITHRGRRGQTFEYELVWQPPTGDTDTSKKTFPGLVDVAYLKTSRGQTDRFEPPTSPQRGGVEGPTRGLGMLPLPGLTPPEPTNGPESTTRGASHDDAVVADPARNGAAIGAR